MRTGYRATPPLRSALVATALAALAAAAPRAAARDGAPDLAPYRDFVRTAAAGRLIGIARDAMRAHWDAPPGGPPTPDSAAGAGTPHDPSGVRWPGPPVGVFLSLMDGPSTRSCVGSTAPYRGGLAETVRALATEALHADPRRAPIRREELPRLRIVLAFAGAGEPVADPMQVDPGREGLLVSSGGATLAFLPGEARTVSWALREARRTGLLAGPVEQATFRRFPVVSLAERRPAPPQEEEPDVQP